MNVEDVIQPIPIFIYYILYYLYYIVIFHLIDGFILSIDILFQIIPIRSLHYVNHIYIHFLLYILSYMNTLHIFYIGETSQSLYKRFQQHIHSASNSHIQPSSDFCHRYMHSNNLHSFVIYLYISITFTN